VEDEAAKTGAARASRQLRARGAPHSLAITGEYTSAAERAAAGKAARAVAARHSHGDWRPAVDRPDPVALLEEQARTRVPELVPIRYGRMLVSPFAFFRGAALVMAADLAGTPDSGISVQLCGDAHLSNFGLFGTPERRLLFDINDFDETLAGPWEWDLKRLGASFEVAGRERGFSRADRRDVVLAAVGEYRAAIREAAEMGVLEAWYTSLDAAALMDWVRREVKREQLGKRLQKTAAQQVAKARTRDSGRVFARRAAEVDGEWRIVAEPPLIVPLEELIQPGTEWEQADRMIPRLLRAYRRTLLHGEHHPIEEFRYAHTARKVVGVGSVGTRCYIMLLLGRDQDLPLFLQVKEAEASVLERFLGPSRYRHHGRRVVMGQRLLQAASDLFLGWQRLKGIDGVTRDFYVRQLHDWKGGIEVEQLGVPDTVLYARVCGRTLARAHARRGDRIAMAAYLGKADSFDRAIAAFSSTYADQNERDYEAFAGAVRAGRIDAETGL
jgi:uncharacterized protein (DUF2252 family)